MRELSKLEGPDSSSSWGLAYPSVLLHKIHDLLK